MITIRHLKKEYPGVTPLKDVSVEINRGDVISVIGPSGTGKSTLIRCLNLLEQPTAGEIIIDGEIITDKDCDISRVRQKMGMVFQNFNLFPHMTVIENVMTAPVDLRGKSRQQAYEDGMQLLRMVGLADKYLNYPDELSGGQKQRVAIARALAMEPEILLFDEPTSALDPAMVREVQSVIRDLAKKGLTMIVVTHEMKFARDICNRVFYMDEGGIYEDGTPEQIFEHPQKEKTRQFVYHLKVKECLATSHDFDFIGFIMGLEEFGREHHISQKIIYYLQSFLEEMCMQLILPKLPEEFLMSVHVEYAEENDEAHVTIRYSGVPFNPLESDNELALVLAEKAAEIIYAEEKGEKFTNTVRAKISDR